MKTNDAWDQLKTTLEEWIALYGMMKDTNSNQKKWCFQSVLNVMNGLEEEYE